MLPFVYRLQLKNCQKVYIEMIDSDGHRQSHECNLRLEKLEALTLLHQTLKAGEWLDANAIRQLGQDLMGILLDDGHQRNFLNFYQKAKGAVGAVGDTATCLRVEFDLDRGLPELASLAALPWELLSTPIHFNHPAAGLTISHDPNVVFYRPQFGYYQERRVIQLTQGEPLRIALVVASPEFDTSGDSMTPVIHEPILTHLQTLTKTNPGRIELLPIETDLTLEKLEAVLDLKPHILHFIGHGQFLVGENETSDQAHIVLVRNRRGRGKIAAPLSAEAFGEKFINHQPGVVILQSCEGGMQSTGDALLGVAAQVAQRSIPAVIAMQYQIPNVWALIFAEAFYCTFFDGHGLDVDQATQAGRQAMAHKAQRESGDISHHFAMPVLHRTNPELPIFEIHTTPLNEISPEEQLYQVLLSLDYRWQTLTFQNFIQRHETIAAFLVHGPMDAGQNWLLHRLLTLVPDLSTANRPVISKKLNSPAGTPDRLWRSLRAEVQLPLGENPAQFNPNEAKILAELWQNGHLILRFFNASQGWFETELENFIRDFWSPLVNLVMKHPPPSQFRVIVFLIDADASEDAWQGRELADEIDESWHAEQIIRLERLSEQFSQSDLEDWLLSSGQAHPKLRTQSSSKPKTDELIAQLITQCATSFEMFDHICNLVGNVDWYALLDKREIPYD